MFVPCKGLAKTHVRIVAGVLPRSYQGYNRDINHMQEGTLNTLGGDSELIARHITNYLVQHATATQTAYK